MAEYLLKLGGKLCMARTSALTSDRRLNGFISSGVGTNCWPSGVLEKARGVRKAVVRCHSAFFILLEVRFRRGPKAKLVFEDRMLICRIMEAANLTQFVPMSNGTHDIKGLAIFYCSIFGPVSTLSNTISRGGDHRTNCQRNFQITRSLYITNQLS